MAAALTATSAHAQAAGTEAGLVLILGPPAALTTAVDLVLLMSLVPEGTVGRGRAITQIVFAAVGIGFSVLCLVLGGTTRNSSALWMGLSASSLALQTGSMGLAIYGVLHPTPDAASDDSGLPAPARQRLPAEAPPQLFMLPFSVSL